MKDAINLSGGIWPQIMGGFSVVVGALYSLTIIGAIIGIPAIFMGLAMFRGGSHAKAYCASQNDADGLMAASEFMRFFRIYGIMTCVSLVLVIGFYLVIGAVVLLGAVID